MDTVLIEAVPARALAFDALQVPFTVQLSTIVENIVLARHIKDVLGPATLEHFIKGVELFWFRQLCKVSRMDKERRRRRHGVDAIERNLERRSDILVSLFTEADMAVTDLEKAEIRSRWQRVPRLRDF